MICDEYAQFFMVANAESQAGIPVCFLVNPPRSVQPTIKMAESEAVRLAQKTGGRFFVLAAVAYVEIVDGMPRWTEVSNEQN
jgi:hypothetical protein